MKTERWLDLFINKNILQNKLKKLNLKSAYVNI